MRAKNKTNTKIRINMNDHVLHLGCSESLVTMFFLAINRYTCEYFNNIQYAKFSTFLFCFFLSQICVHSVSGQVQRIVLHTQDVCVCSAHVAARVPDRCAELYRRRWPTRLRRQDSPVHIRPSQNRLHFHSKIRTARSLY